MDIQGVRAVVVKYIREHPGRVLGALVGFVVGLSIIWLGFWRTLVVGLVTALGYAIGKWIDDEGKGLKEFLEEKLPGRPDFH
jgi:uncharacterized membrane protein